jgi:hypothetical protein
VVETRTAFITSTTGLRSNPEQTHSNATISGSANTIKLYVKHSTSNQSNSQTIMSVPPSESIPLQRIDSGTKSTSWDEPLVGLPAKTKVGDQMLTSGPHLPARRAAEAYCKSVGITIPFPKTYKKLNKERAQRIAQLYDDLVSTPDAHEVVAAYEAICKETMAQWEVSDKKSVANPRASVLVCV